MAGPTNTSPRTPAGDLQTILDAVIQSRPDRGQFVDHGDPSDPNDEYFDGVGYNDAFSSWVDDYLAVSNALSKVQQSDMGLVQMTDGTYVSTGDLSPEEAAALNAANMNVYNETMARFGLSQYNLATQRTDRENGRRQADFENKVALGDKKLGLDQANLDSAIADLDRWVSGLQGANAAATLKQNAQQSAIKYGTTNGKTDFSANDLGGALGVLAGQAGISDMNAPLLRYPGVQTMDPMGDIAAAQAAFGTAGAAPMIPRPTTTMADYPAAPDLLPDTTPMPSFPAMAPPMLAVPTGQPAPQLRIPGSPMSPTQTTTYIDPATLGDPNAQIDAGYLNIPRYAGGTMQAPPLLRGDAAAMSVAAGLPAWVPAGVS